MKKLISFISLLILLGCINNQADGIQLIIDHSESQLEYAIRKIKSNQDGDFIYPLTVENEVLKLGDSKDWTSGFFPGNLWMMYELTGNEKWKEEALRFTLPLEAEKWNGETHDLGFKMYCSFGKAIKHSNNTDYRNILIQSAKILSIRFDPVVGCIRSWDYNTDKWNFPVSIDNMMDLELLLWAAKETGNENFKEIAIKHAQTTMKNHFRSDYSSYHVVDFNPETGEVENKHIHQRFSHESSWARGQALGLYGFTMMYRETGMEEFLIQAEKIAGYILSQKGIKEGKIPYWDFNAPKKPYDASAGAIICSALFELHGFSKNRGEYLNVAEKLLATLSSSEFLAPIGTNNGFLLKHSAGNRPHSSEINVPMVYADYYYLESIIKSKDYNGQHAIY
jgi:unsaturated chondroitin disaccharide hydrolase